MKGIIYWYYSLSMEEIFILTGIMILVIGIALGLFCAMLMDKPERKEDCPKKGRKNYETDLHT